MLRRTNLVVVISGFDPEYIQEELRTGLMLFNFAIPDTRELDDLKQWTFSDTSVYYWPEDNTGVFVVIEPTVTSLIRILQYVFSQAYYVVYYGGHGSDEVGSRGDWILSEDEEYPNGLFTYSKLKSLLSSCYLGFGEIYINCCYSDSWRQNNIVESNRTNTGALHQLRAGTPHANVIANVQFNINQARILVCYKDRTPVICNFNTISNEIRKNKFNFMAEYTDLAYAYLIEHFFRSTELVNVTGIPPKHSLALYVFSNGGSGDNFLITGGYGKTNIIIDGNHGNYFRRAWANVLGKIQKFDLVIGSHVDNDHIRGLEVLMTSPVARLRVKELWLNSPILNVGARIAMRGPTTASNILRYRVHDYRDTVRGKCKVINSSRVQVLWPSQKYLNENRDSNDSDVRNNLSIISVLTTTRDGVKTRMLFPGDADFIKIFNALDFHGMLNITFDLVVLPHHGSVKSNRFSSNEQRWVHGMVKSKRYVLTGNRKNSTDKDSTPSKELCRSLDVLLIKDKDVEVFLTHGRFKCYEYFPNNYQSNRIYVAVDGKMVINF